MTEKQWYAYSSNRAYEEQARDNRRKRQAQADIEEQEENLKKLQLREQIARTKIAESQAALVVSPVRTRIRARKATKAKTNTATKAAKKPQPAKPAGIVPGPELDDPTKRYSLLELD